MSRFAKLGKPRIVDNYCVRLIFAYRSVDFVLVPIGGLIPCAVKPKTAYFAVLCTQNFDTFVKIIYVLGEVLRVVGITPIQPRMVEKRRNAALVARIHKFGNQVTSACGVRRVVVVKTAGVVQTVTVVMTSRQCDVLATCLFGNGDKPCRPIALDYKFAHQVAVCNGVAVFIQAVVPLAFAHHAVQAEMHKQTETALFKFFHISLFTHFFFYTLTNERNHRLTQIIAEKYSNRPR